MKHATQGKYNSFFDYILSINDKFILTNQKIGAIFKTYYR